MWSEQKIFILPSGHQSYKMFNFYPIMNKFDNLDGNYDHRLVIPFIRQVT